MSYRITTESTCDLSREMTAERGIDVIGMRFSIDGQEDREGPQCGVSPKAFYDQLREKKPSSTSQVTAYEFMEFIEPMLAAGEDVLHVCFSSGLSGTYASCLQGAEELREKYPERKLVIVDSLCASMGQGLFVYYADENRKAGMSLEDNAAWLEAHKLNLCHWFTVDDLMFLHRGGRVSKTSAVLGTLIGIKPVLHVDDEGHLILVSKVRGRNASIDALCARLVETANEDIAEQTVFISHGDCVEDAQRLGEMIKAKTGCKEVVINHIGAVIGSHSGPGTVALFFMGRQR